MRKSILAMLLAAVSSSAAADVWFEIGVNEKFTAYADPATIKKEGNTARMWTMFDYKTAQATNAGKKYLSTKRQLEYDCTEARARVLAVTFYAGGQAKGETVAESNMSLAPTKVVPGSADDMLLKYACAK